jgi:hypothetical protein
MKGLIVWYWVAQLWRRRHSFFSIAASSIGWRTHYIGHPVYLWSSECCANCCSEDWRLTVSRLQTRTGQLWGTGGLCGPVSLGLHRRLCRPESQQSSYGRGWIDTGFFPLGVARRTVAHCHSMNYWIKQHPKVFCWHSLSPCISYYAGLGSDLCYTYLVLYEKAILFFFCEKCQSNSSVHAAEHPQSYFR